MGQTFHFAGEDEWRFPRDILCVLSVHLEVIACEFHFLLDALLREEVTQAAAPMWILFSSCFGCNHV